MSFKQEFLTELRAGASDRVLLGIVHKHAPSFANMRPMYDVLHEIWSEYGFDDGDADGPFRDELEYVMEKVWYQCPMDQKA